ncbi:MAG: hypothetical protein KJO21_13195 [Verrucomicrobiae bacterium]|nr:hypothetical protein [Verrucomicrobiae bacterium]NNJ44275.1 hypothetical protein [Akkermansiaceae bacterium]
MEEIDGRIIILILFVVVSAFKWLGEKIKTRGEQPDHNVSESLHDIYEDFREEIRHRQTAMKEQQAPPPMPQAATPSPQAPPPTRPKKVSLSSEQQAAADRFNQRMTPGSMRRAPHRNVSQAIRKLLASPQSCQQAIVLQEILGKPKSMQDT